MKDILKSKYLILFVIFILGMTYINAIGIAQKNASAENTDNHIMCKQ